MHRAPQETRTYFLTLVTANRRRIFQVTSTAELLIHHLQTQRTKNRMIIDAFVLMPDHVHLLLTPAHDISLEKAVQYIKGGFSFLLKSKLDVWERGYNEAQVKTPEQFQSFCKYIENNPVRAGLASQPEEYIHSSSGRPDLVDPPAPWLCRD